MGRVGYGHPGRAELPGRGVVDNWHVLGFKLVFNPSLKFFRRLRQRHNSRRDDIARFVRQVP